MVIATCKIADDLAIIDATINGENFTYSLAASEFAKACADKLVVMLSTNSFVSPNDAREAVIKHYVETAMLKKEQGSCLP